MVSVCIKFAVKKDFMKDIDSAKIISIRISSEKERQVLKRIAKETGCRQMSKALMKTAEGYERMCDLSRRQAEEIKRLHKELQMYRKYANLIANTCKAMQAVQEQPIMGNEGGES